MCELSGVSELGHIKDQPPSIDICPLLSPSLVPHQTKAQYTHSKTMDTCPFAGKGKAVTSLPSVRSQFKEHALPTPKQLLDASSCVVIAESGVRIPFGDLFKHQKSIIIFIRHFW